MNFRIFSHKENNFDGKRSKLILVAEILRICATYLTCWRFENSQRITNLYPGQDQDCTTCIPVLSITDQKRTPNKQGKLPTENPATILYKLVFSVENIKVSGSSSGTDEGTLILPKRQKLLISRQRVTSQKTFYQYRFDTL